MKTYAPKGLRGTDLRGLLFDLAATPAQVARYLEVSERSLWRWLRDDSAPRAVLACLWLETPHGRHVAALDVGNELVITKGLARSLTEQATKQAAQLCRILAISDTGAANDALLTGPLVRRPSLRLELGCVRPLGFDPTTQGRQLADDDGGQHGTGQHGQGFAGDFGQAG